MKNFITFVVLLSFGLFLAVSPVRAGNTTISSNSTTAQTLTSAGTLTISSDITLNVSGSSSGKAAVTFNDSTTGDVLTVTNSGTIEQSGTSALGNTNNALTDSHGGSNIFINNNAGALIETADDDVIHMSKSSNNVTINNSGSIISLNASSGSNQAINLSGINSTGITTINNNVGGLIKATEADAIRPGLNGIINNSGTIIAVTSDFASSDAIEASAQSGKAGNSGVVITNTSTGLIEGGKHAITGGNTDTTTSGSFTMTISNSLGGVIQGDNGSGINIDGFNANEVVTVNNAGTITGNGVNGDGDGVDVDGIVNITNSGTIKSLNAFNDTSEGITVGGGTITNSGTIEGSVSSPTGNTAVGRGITLAGLDKDPTTGLAIPIEKTYIASVVTNTGLIKGDSDAGIGILGINTTPTGTYTAQTFDVTINNNTGGVIEGGGYVGAIDGSGDFASIGGNASMTGTATISGTASMNNETVNNSGMIIADNASSGAKAISLGTGSNHVNITGGSVIGDMSGFAVSASNPTVTATLTINTTGTFNYGYVISNFSSVDIQSGTTIFSGANTYSGTTSIEGILNLTGSGTIGNTSTLTISGTGIFDLGGKTVTVGTLANSGMINNGVVSASMVGGLSGSGFNKTGSDTLVISGTNTYTGGTTVSQGKLSVNGSILGNVNVVTGAELGGSGTISGTLSGSGKIGPGNSPGILTAASTDPTGGLSYNFEMTKSGTAIWSVASASGNDVLHLTAALPFSAPLTSANDINVYFSQTGLTFDGGFFTEGSSDNLTANISNATYNFFVLDSSGTITYNGNNYDALTSSVTGTVIQITGANFASGTVNGFTEQFTVAAVPEPSSYALLGIGLLGLLLVSRRRSSVNRSR